jgi:hypothetical protein
MPSLPCVVAFSLVDLKTFGPLALRSSPFYLVHPSRCAAMVLLQRRDKELPQPCSARIEIFPNASRSSDFGDKEIFAAGILVLYLLALIYNIR